MWQIYRSGQNRQGGTAPSAPVSLVDVESFDVDVQIVVDP